MSRDQNRLVRTADKRFEVIRDLATEQGTSELRTVSVGEYLGVLGLYKAEEERVGFDPAIATSFQRAALDIRKNPIKQRMFRDLCRGGTLPPLVVYERESGNGTLEIIDGIQRTHVMVEALRALMSLEAGEEPEEYAQTEFSAIREQGQVLLTVKEFLSRPVVLQVWEALKADELIRLFMVLNAGQQKVSPRHLLEVMNADLRSMFEAWGMRLLTEKEEKLIPKRRGRKPPEAMPIPSVTHFRYEFLIDGLIAYVSRDPQIKTRRALQDTDGISQRLSERVMEIGSEVCKHDFQWVCLEVNGLINKKYADTPKWRGIIQTSDNFFIPLMAALGEAGARAQTQAKIAKPQAELLKLLTASRDEDPLRFYTGGTDCLEKILDEVRSNIGRRRRAIVYFAWRSFFRWGAQEPNYPIDWRSAVIVE